MSLKPSRQLGAILRTVPSATVSEPTSELAASKPPQAIEPSPHPERVEQSINRHDQAVAIASAADSEVPLQVNVPKRIRRELLIMAADQNCSVRALILRGVRSLGIQIDDDELRDKRRKP